VARIYHLLKFLSLFEQRLQTPSHISHRLPPSTLHCPFCCCCTHGGHAATFCAKRGGHLPVHDVGVEAVLRTVTSSLPAVPRVSSQLGGVSLRLWRARFCRALTIFTGRCSLAAFMPTAPLRFCHCLLPACCCHHAGAWQGGALQAISGYHSLFDACASLERVLRATAWQPSARAAAPRCYQRAWRFAAARRSSRALCAGASAMERRGSDVRSRCYAWRGAGAARWDCAGFSSRGRRMAERRNGGLAESGLSIALCRRCGAGDNAWRIQRRQRATVQLPCSLLRCCAYAAASPALHTMGDGGWTDAGGQTRRCQQNRAAFDGFMDAIPSRPHYLAEQAYISTSPARGSETYWTNGRQTAACGHISTVFYRGV